MDTLIGLAAFLTQFQGFLWLVGVAALCFNQADALAEARGGGRRKPLSFLCVWVFFLDLFLMSVSDRRRRRQHRCLSFSDVVLMLRRKKAIIQERVAQMLVLIICRRRHISSCF